MKKPLFVSLILGIVAILAMAMDYGTVTGLGDVIADLIYPPANTRLCIKPTTDAYFFYFADKDGNAIMTVDSTNNRVGIGTQTPAYPLVVYAASGSNRVQTQSDSIANGQSALVLTNATRSGSALSRSAYISAYYHDGIPETCGVLMLEPNDGDNNYLWVDNSDLLRISTTITHAGTTSGTVVGDQTSDIRMKKEIKNMDYGLAEILQINPISFKFKDLADQNSRIGFSAQEVKEIIPEAVYDTKEDAEDDGGTVDELDGKKKKRDRLAMRYVDLIPVLVNAIKEQQLQIEDLKKRLDKLENK